MGGRKKILLWVTGCLAFIFIVFIGLVFLLPYLVNLAPIKEKILTLFFRQVTGRMEYQKIDLHYFPRPWVEVHRVTLSIHEKVAGTLKSVQVYPELRALLKGELRVSRIQIESPDFTIQFPMERENIKEKPEATALKEFEEIVARVSVIGPNLKVVMKGGRLNLVRQSKAVLSFYDIEAYMIGRPREAKLEMTCRSSLWGKMSLEAAIDPVDLKAHGHIEMASFRPHLLPGFFSPDFPLNVTDSQLNLNISFETKGQEALLATLEGSTSKLTFGKGNEETAIKWKRLRGAFRMEGERIEISLDELNLEYPRLTLSGKFTIDRKEPFVVVEVQGRELDVASTAEVALRLAGKIPVTKTIFGIVKGGRIPLITFQSRARTMSDLDETERFTIKGSILDGKISTPVGEQSGNGEDFTLEKTTGDVVISRGFLEGRNLRTQWKHQQLQEGKLRVGLKGDDAPFHLEIGVETDLSLLPLFLNRVVKDRAFREETARIRQIEGRAAGRLVLGESLQSIGVKADVQDLNLRGRHDRIPYPVTIDRGAVSFDEEKLRLRNLSGKVGNSSFADLTAQIGFERDPSLGISSGRLVVSLDELYPWLSSYEALRDDLKKIQSAKGKVTLSGMRLSGPLMRPGKWDFETAGELKDLIVSTSLLPDPLAVSSGRFGLSPEKMTLADLQTKFLHASLNVSGVLYDYRRGLEKAELSLSGLVTPKDFQWLSNSLGLGPKIQVRSPVRIGQAQLSWRQGAEISFRGDLSVQNGPEISLDILRNPQGIKINNLVIHDGLSHAAIKLDLKGRAMEITFSGLLAEKTLDAVFSDLQSQDGWVRGDFQGHIDLDQPMQSVAHGKIEANHLSIPSRFEKALEIGEISLSARGDRITIERANFMWDGKRLDLSGDVSFSEKGVWLDLDLFTESVDLNNVREFLNKGRRDQGLQVQGTIRFKTKSLSYERLILSPFYADIVLDPHGADVVIKEANLCGISTPGSVKIAKQSLSLDLRPSSKSQGIESTFRCLLDQEMRVKGDFDLKGRAFAQGKPEDLIRSLKGNVEFQAKHGHLYYSVGLMRILEFINATEIYRGRLPLLGEKGIEYNLIKIRGSFQNGKLIMEEATLDGTALQLVAKGEIDLMNQGLNLMVLVAPLKTMDRIIRLIPLVGEILGGSLLTIPLRLHGSLKDPEVTSLSPSAIGFELSGMMKRTLRLPFKIIEPFMSRKKEDSGEER